MSQENKDVDYVFHPRVFNSLYFHLKEAFKNNLIRFIWCFGGSSASKTYSLVQAIITEMLEDSTSNTLVLRKYSTDIKDSIYADFKAVIEKWELNDRFIIQQNFILCSTGAYIRFRGLDDPEKVKGISGFKRVVMEEANQFDEADLKQIKKRLRGIIGQQIIPIFNPISKEHWIKKKVFDLEKFREVESNITGKFYNEKGNMLFLKTTYRDNKYIIGPHFIDQHVIDDFEWDKINDPDSYDVYANGNWGELKTVNPFATQYDPKKHESKECVFDPNKQLIISIDFNLNPFAVIFSNLWLDQQGYHSHTFDEASIENGSIHNMVELIKTRYKNQLPNCKITGDSMGKRRQQGLPDLASFYDQLQRGLGLRDSQIVTPNNPTHENSRTDVNYVLYHFPDFKINPDKCPNLCRDMRVVQCDAFGQIIKKNRNDLSQLADHLDTKRYYINTFLFDWKEKHQKHKLPVHKL